jgi:hypothetical protein
MITKLYKSSLIESNKIPTAGTITSVLPMWGNHGVFASMHSPEKNLGIYGGPFPI